MTYSHQPVRKAWWRRHPVLTGAAALFAVWMLWEGWYVTFAIATAMLVLIAVRRSRRARRLVRAGLLARAEFEHRLVQFGDQRGVFGRYPPVQAGWYPDPTLGPRNRWQWRYFDGAAWTAHAVRR